MQFQVQHGLGCIPKLVQVKVMRAEFPAIIARRNAEY
jgi:hypothetical protein